MISNRARPFIFLTFSLCILVACKTISSPPPQQDGTVVITFNNDATGASLTFSDAGTGSVSLGNLSSDPILIDPFTYPFYDTVLFLHMENPELHDIRVQRLTVENGIHELRVEQRVGDHCAPWTVIGTVPVIGMPGARLEGFGEPITKPELFELCVAQ